MDAEPPNIAVFRAQASLRRAEFDAKIARLRAQAAAAKPVGGSTDPILALSMRISAIICQQQADSVSEARSRSQAMTKTLIDLLA